MAVQNVKIQGWKVDLTVDDDGHLTVGINHDDATRVDDIGFDIATNDQEWVERFTTKAIEDAYNG